MKVKRDVRCWNVSRGPTDDPHLAHEQSVRLILREQKRKREFEGQECANSVAGKPGIHQNASEKVGNGRMLESGFAYGSGGAKTGMREQRGAAASNHAKQNTTTMQANLTPRTRADQSH